MRNIQYSWIGGLNLLTMNSHQMDIEIWFPVHFLVETDRLILEFMWKSEVLGKPKEFWKRIKSENILWFQDFVIKLQ